MKSALIVRGGWEGHQPKEVSEIFAEDLRAEGFDVEISDTLDTFVEKGEGLKNLSLIVPIWTMGEITWEHLQPVLEAVKSGVGMAGCHGGMCDSFRASTEWQFLTGGQWVAHPGNDGVKYMVHITDHDSPITNGLSDFEVVSEQYYLHVDPANHVLATTRFPVVDGPHATNGPVDMPVAWTKMYGAGRVFYSSLGHQANVIDHGPAREMLKRGMLWAAG